MSDLLSRIVARARGLASPVEPILASRFEPHVAFDVPRNGEPGVLPVSRAAAELPAQQSARPVDSTELTPAAGTRAPSAQPRPPRDPARRDVEREAEVPLEAIAVSETTTPKAHYDLPTAWSRVEAETEETVTAPAIVRAVKPHVDEPHFEDATTYLEVPVAVTLEEMETQPRPARTRPSPVKVVRPEIHIPQAQPGPRMAEVHPEPARPIEVQVTIGHIEVRSAAVQQAPPAPRRIARPSVSLDDYLRRRNGDAR